MFSDEVGGPLVSWRKPKRSLGSGECIEVGLAQGRIVVRDSKNHSGGILVFSATAWRGFVLHMSGNSG
jgi:hypothetical protein